MARTHIKHARVYVGGYDLSSYVMTLGSMGIEHDTAVTATLTESIKTLSGGFGQAQPVLGQLNGVFDNTAATGLHALHATPGSPQIVTVALGMLAAPAAGDVVYAAEHLTTAYGADSGQYPVGATLVFGGPPSTIETPQYGQVWGTLLHPSGAETAVNGGTANHDYGAATALGGVGILHVLAGNGTCTFKIEHSATNTDAQFDATGAVVTFDTTAAASPFAEIKCVGKTTTVQRYLRWQITLGTATTVTFVMSFIRGA
jgi:hypothetical protein